MSTMAEISAAIDQITTKKQTLFNSFLNLRSHTPISFNLPFNWSDLDTHFTNLQSTLKSKFNLLQTHHPLPEPNYPPARPELKAFCTNSDGFGLKRFISGNPDQESILSELPDAYRFAPDAAGMVLDALVGFYGCKGSELRLGKSVCLVMLEGLLRGSSVVKDEVKSRAMEVAVEWNKKRVLGGVKAREKNALGFLLLVGAYGLVECFSIDDVIDSFVVVAADRRNVDLCRRIVPESNIKDMIQKLIDNQMHVPAVNFSIDFQKTNEFSPVGLLEDRKLRSLRVIEEARANVEDLNVRNDVIITEINTLKSIIECVEENHLQSDYSKDSVVELVTKLENEVENNKQTLVNNPPIRKQPARAVVLKHQLPSKSKRSKRRKLNKVQPTAEPAEATTVQEVNWVKEFQSPISDLSSPLGSGPAGTSGVRVGEYNNSPPTGSNGVNVGESHSSPLGSGPTGSNAPCVSPVASLGGSARVDIGYNFYVKMLQPPSDDNSNGWISD